jgi:uncharacterized protein YqiB (DUF1249 family)
MNLLRERYRLDLVELQATCAANYVRLLRLLPQLPESPCGREHQATRRVAFSQGEQVLGVLALEVLQAGPYTTTLMLRQEQALPWLPVPSLQVRVYHDARMAEVVSADHTRCLRSTYVYPNRAMHQPDEKTQLNLFLGEWLRHCLACGHELQPVV